MHYLTSDSPRALEAGELIELDIQDVQLVATALQDDRGQTHWTAEPQQLPFLRALSIGQIRAQTNDTK
jgi:hypothetical protein